MVVLLATGAVPAAVAGLLAACAMVLSGVLIDRAGVPRHLVDDGDPRRRDDLALDGDDRERRGRASSPTRLVHVVGDAGPYALLLGLFLLTAVLGQLISNMATALIVIPIAVSAAAELDVSAKPVLMAVTVFRRGVVPDPGRDACEPDGHGARRVPVRRLLEARPTVARAVRRGRGRSRPGDLGILNDRRGSDGGEVIARLRQRLVRIRRERTLRREAEMMGFTVCIALLAALSYGDDHAPHSELGVLAIVWGATIGLALTHWFAFMLSVRLVDDPGFSYSPLEMALETRVGGSSWPRVAGFAVGALVLGVTIATVKWLIGAGE